MKSASNGIQILIVLGIIALVMFIVGKIMSKFKFPKIGCVALVTGAVKSGKSTFAVALSIQKYKQAHRMWVIRKFFQELLRRKVDEEPLLYSNIPLAVPYVPLTKDLIQRKKRFRYKSVVYVNEASLMADSMLGAVKGGAGRGETELVAERLMLFNKLFGHETYSGYLIYDTQAIVDLHFSIKRCISEYFYIHHLQKYIPFLLCANVREERHSEDNSTINAYTDDVEKSLSRVLIPKSVWKKFDAHCFSYLTDDLPVEDNVIRGCKDLKARSVISFRDFKTINIVQQNTAQNATDKQSLQSAKEVVKNAKNNTQS